MQPTQFNWEHKHQFPALMDCLWLVTANESTFIRRMEKAIKGIPVGFGTNLTNIPLQEIKGYLIKDRRNVTWKDCKVYMGLLNWSIQKSTQTMEPHVSEAVKRMH